VQPLQALAHLAGALGSAIWVREALDALEPLRVADGSGRVAIIVHPAVDTLIVLAPLSVLGAIRVLCAVHAHGKGRKTHALGLHTVALALARRNTPTVASVTSKRGVAAVLGRETLSTLLGEAVGFVVLAVTTRHAVHARVRGGLAELVAAIGVRQTSHAKAAVAVGCGGRAHDVWSASSPCVLGFEQADPVGFTVTAAQLEQEWDQQRIAQ